MGGEDQLCPWPRESDKGQACQNSCEAEPADDLRRRDYMTLQRDRIHLAIADGRERLNAEEERIGKAIWPSIGHRTGH